MISKDLNDEQKNDLKKKWGKFRTVASSEKRLEIIATDINYHFIKNLQGTTFKAMLATNSRFEAIKYHSIFEKYENIKTAFVISAPDTREGYSEVDEENKDFIIKNWNKIIDTYISADEVNKLTKLVNIFDEDFDKEIERVVGDNAKADSIISAVTKVITEKREQNPAYYDKLSERIQEILEKYKEKRLSDEEKLKYAKDIRSMLTKKNDADSDKYPEAIRKSKVAKSFYDNLQEKMGFLKENILIDFIIKTEEIFKDFSKKPDWQNNVDVKNEIDQTIDDLLWDIEKINNVKFTSYDEIINEIRSIGINNYAEK